MQRKSKESRYSEVKLNVSIHTSSIKTDREAVSISAASGSGN